MQGRNAVIDHVVSLSVTMYRLNRIVYLLFLNFTIGLTVWLGYNYGRLERQLAFDKTWYTSQMR